MIDSYNRKLDYLRVSITDRCNLRCVFCMPSCGVEWKPHDSMLTFEEILRTVRIMAELGVRKIKVTGGEPLLRKGTASFLGKLKATAGIEKVTLTTNGLLLDKYLEEAETLGQASLPDGVNISLDALNPERFSRITRADKLSPVNVLASIDRLHEKQVLVKVNCVPIRGLNEEDIVPLAALARGKKIVVRFIELMPLGSAVDYKPVSGSETAGIIEKAFGTLEPFFGIESNGPAVYYSLPGFAGKIGFINPISHGFCESCNRLRLTSEGSLKLCLSSSLEFNLRDLLRSGISDAELANNIVEFVAKKPRVHTLSGVYGEHEEHKTGGMFEIGG